MGKSKRHDKLRCSNCYKKNKGWNNIQVICRKGEGVKCKCLNCGHEYISYSQAAYRLINHKSIYSEAGNETQTVTDNEAEKEFCQICGRFKVLKSEHLCADCFD